jgi:uncharacterized membrane protein YkvA (DUF1232 family)
LAAALVYGASPLDLIPDLIPLLGLSDDAGAVVLGLLLTIRAIARLRSQRNGKQARPVGVQPLQRFIPAHSVQAHQASGYELP